MRVEEDAQLVGEGLITFRDVHVLRFLKDPKG